VACTIYNDVPTKRELIAHGYTKQVFNMYKLWGPRKHFSRPQEIKPRPEKGKNGIVVRSTGGVSS
jgi:hypothetical protein